MLGNLLPSEQRAISFQALWAADDALISTTEAGTIITQDDALRINTVFACVRLIGDTISTLPIDTYRRIDGDRVPYRPRPQWLDYPDSDVTREDHFLQVLVSMLIAGEAFVRLLRLNGEIVGLVCMNPRRIEISRERYTDGTLRIVYRVKGTDEVIEKQDMLHIPDMRLPGELHGKSRIELMRQSLGLAKALDEFASRFFGQGSVTSGIIEYPNALTKEQSETLRNQFEAKHRGVRKAHRTGILSGGAKWVKTGVDPNEAQMLESRKHAIEEVARLFRCPPSMIGVTTPGAMAYASVEQNGIHFVQHTLRPFIVKLENAYSRLLPNEAFVKFSVEGLLRGDTMSRFSAYATGIQSGFLNINDIHRLEDMRSVDGGDVYRVPLANIDLAAANIAETERKASVAQKLIWAGFDPSATMKALGLPEIPHTGVPSTQLQPISQINPDDPESVYP
jgi:HK97 family phage portal protein